MSKIGHPLFVWCISEFINVMAFQIDECIGVVNTCLCDVNVIFMKRNTHIDEKNAEMIKTNAGIEVANA